MFQKSLRIYRNEGLSALFTRARSYIKLQSKRILISPIRRRYWDYQGEQDLRIGETVVTLDSSQRHGGDIIRSHYNSECQILNHFVHNMKSDDIVWDVGAHLGLYTCFAANSVEEGEVISFEPFPPNLIGLMNNSAKNNESNITVIGGALSDSTGLTRIDSPNITENYGSPSIEGRRSPLRMESFAGDDLISNGTFPTPTIVKIDVEGAEGLVLDGLSEALSKDECRQLYCEIHPPATHRSDVTDFGWAAEGVVDQIHELNFQIEKQYTRGSDRIIIASK